MPEYQLPAAIALAAATAISASVNLATAKQEGKIKLEGPEAEQQEHDPFNVTTSEDVAPGEPIDGPQFWSRVCTLTLFLTISAYFHFIFRFASSNLFFSSIWSLFSFSKLYHSDGRL